MNGKCRGDKEYFSHVEMENMIDNSLLPTQGTRIVENDQHMKANDLAFNEHLLELRKTPIDESKVQDSYSRYQITRNELNRNL